MKIMVANKDEYIDYFSKRTDTLNVSVLKEQENYIIHSIESEENNVSSIYSSINNLLDQQYEKGKYIRLEQLKELDSLFKSLNEEQCKIINAYAQVNQINSFDEIKELIANINDYQILGTHSLEEVGKLLTEKSPEYEISDEMKEFVNYSKLAKQYLSSSNIEEKFCSYGLLVNTRNMLTNDLIQENITSDKVLQIEVANRKLFEESSYNNRITLCLPIETERLKQKFELIGLNFDNLSKDDTHITFCRLVNYKNEKLSNAFDFVIEKLIDKIPNKYENMISFQEVESLYNEIKNYDNISMSKLVAILEANENNITNFEQIVEYAKNTKQYEVIPDIKNYEDMGRYLVNETGHFDDVCHLEDYINYEKLAKDYTQKGYTYNGDFTSSGFLIKKEEFEIEINKPKEEEEEFE